MLSPWEIGVIGVVVVLLFGTKRLPELGSGLGKAISNFKRSYKEGTELDITPKNDKQESSTKQEG
jgi:sec-independent protein translocase protein TatA